MPALITRIILLSVLTCAWPLTGNAKEYIVPLSQTAVDVLDRQHYVQEVIVSPEVGTTIGFVQKGLGNTRVPAFLEGEVSQTLHRFFQRLLPDAGAEPLIVRVNRLRISEITYFAKELAYCEVSLDIMARRDGQLVLLYRTGNTRTVKGMDVTSGHANNVAQALVACFREFNARVQEGRLFNVPLAHPDSAHANLVPVADWLTEEEHNAGLFATYTDFRDGRIDTVTTFTITESVNKHGITTYKVKVKDSRAKRKPWGFTDGRYAYVRLDKEYVQLTHQENGWATYNKIRPVMDNTNAVAIGVMGGLIGAMIAHSVTAQKQEFSAQHIALDPWTGQLLPELFDNNMADQVEIILYHSGYSKAAAPIRITVGDRQVNLPVKSYTRIMVPLTREPLKISVTGTGEHTQEFAQKLGSYETAVMLVKEKKSGRLLCDLLEDEVRLSILDKLEKSTEVPAH